MSKTRAMGLCLAIAALAVGCGGDDEGGDEPQAGMGAGTAGSAGSAGSSAGSAGSAGDSSTAGSAGSAGGGAGSAGTSAGSAGSSGASGSGDEGGGQLGFCESSGDCDDGLACYEPGQYCSAECEDDEDCASLGESFGCSMSGGGGMMGGFGGGFGQPDGGAGTTGVCRATCEGEDDDSCPSGLSCLSVGFGGGMMGGGGTFRCGYDGDPNDDGNTGGDGGTGTAAAFEACEEDGDCADGLGCSGGPGGGYCSEECESEDDCTETPGSGDAEITCGFGGNCTLSCTPNETECPSGMTCVAFGGGGMGMGGGMGRCAFE